MAVQETRESFALEEKVGSAMRARRQELNLTLNEVAALCGTSAQTISRLETAEMTISVKWLEKVALALRCDPVEFFERKLSALRMLKEATENLVGEIEQARLAFNAKAYPQLAVLGERGE